ncbi:MAG: hypothetical protein AAFU41_17930 [Pseudomonadota bacterium]
MTYSANPLTDGGRVEGWVSIRPGKCFSTPTNSFRTTSFGFAALSRDGQIVPLKFDFNLDGRLSDAVSTICAPRNPNGFKYSGGPTRVEAPCLSHEIAIPVSFSILGGDNDVQVSVAFNKAEVEARSHASHNQAIDKKIIVEQGGNETRNQPLVIPTEEFPGQFAIQEYERILRNVAREGDEAFVLAALRGVSNELIRKHNLPEQFIYEGDARLATGDTIDAYFFWERRQESNPLLETLSTQFLQTMRESAPERLDQSLAKLLALDKSSSIAVTFHIAIVVAEATK